MSVCGAAGSEPFEVVAEAQIDEVPIRLLHDQRLHFFGRHLQIGIRPAQATDGADHLVSQESIALGQCIHQDVHRLLAGNARQRARDVATGPDVLVLIAEEIRQRVEHGLAISDEHVSRRRLQQPVPEQGDQWRHEEEVAGAKLAGAADRFRGDLAIRVVHHRHEQRMEVLVSNRAQGLGDIATRAGHR